MKNPSLWTSLLLSCTSVAALAGEPETVTDIPEESVNQSAWEFGFRPYVWMTGLNGTIGANGVTSPVDIDFGDILGNLDMVWSSTLEANRGKWGVLLDFTYLKLSDNFLPTFGTSPPPIAPSGFEMEMFLLDLVGSYRISEWDSGALHLTGGVRWLSIENNINLATPAGPFGSAGAKDDWFDPHLGFRIHHDLSPCCYLRGFADVGGFGVGSDLTYQALAAFGYRATEHVAVELGYRYLSEDYDNSPNFSFDAEMHGPILGISIVW
ncbi:MAG: hypothetical protein ACPG4K_01020 [Haloferula sp.]